MRVNHSDSPQVLRAPGRVYTLPRRTAMESFSFQDPARTELGKGTVDLLGALGVGA
jgi:hypothetical protein